MRQFEALRLGSLPEPLAPLQKLVELQPKDASARFALAQAAEELGDRKTAIRNAVNQWIRSKSPFDAVIDFDDVMRARTNPDLIEPAFNCGDGIHPSPLGYFEMGKSISLDGRHPLNEAPRHDPRLDPRLLRSAVGAGDTQSLPPTFAARRLIRDRRRRTRQ